MFYHANTCKKCCYVLHVGLGHAGLYVAYYSVLYVSISMCQKGSSCFDVWCDVFRKISRLSSNAIQFYVLTFVRYVDVTFLGICFQMKPQTKQPNWFSECSSQNLINNGMASEDLRHVLNKKLQHEKRFWKKKENKFDLYLYKEIGADS